MKVSTEKSFKRQKEKLPFLGVVEKKGTVQELKLDTDCPQVYYSHPNGKIWFGDSIKWLTNCVQPESVDLIFADPPYNIKKAEWDTFESQKAYIEWSVQWIEAASKALKPEGTLYICGFSEILADLKFPAMNYFKGCRWIIWHYKNKANLGSDWGRSHESILHLRKTKKFTFNINDIRIPYSEHTLKYPSHPQAITSQFGKEDNNGHVWHPNPDGAKPKDVLDIPTTCNGMHEKTSHATQKPEELLRKIILASSNEGDVILDPFLGSGTTAVCAEQLNRKWLGCDITAEYLTWAVERLELVEEWSIEKWKKYDFENLKRRNSIR